MAEEISGSASQGGRVTADDAVSLKEHAEAMFGEHRRYLDSLSGERERTEALLREAEHRATALAEVEREKAAVALRIELSRAIQEGDDRLREHVSNQIVQIREALASAERLELERISAADERTNAVKRELQLVQNSAREAIQKAEAAAEKRFEAVNEFRASLSDQTASFMPREVAETQFAEMRKQLTAATDRLNTMVGEGVGVRRSHDAAQPWQLWAAGAIMTAFITAIVLIADLATSQ